jgi:hypothetical protein
MSIPRVHFFELEDQGWFPAVVRRCATDYLNFVEIRFSLERAVVPLLRDALAKTQSKTVVDLCSGGSAMIFLLNKAFGAEGPKFVLTDLYPDLSAFDRIAGTAAGQISYYREPVNAKSVPPNIAGFRTMFNAFHHFAPADAVEVLRNAVEARQPIGIFETPERSWRTILPMFFLVPWMVLFWTPFIRPFRWSRIFWTYVVPMVPLTVWWDGIVSQLRGYTPEELEKLAAETKSASYRWTAGKTPFGSVPGELTYLIGLPE